MPTLLAKHEFLDKNPLQFKFDLLGAEDPANWEGWLEYKIELYNGDELVTELVERATIIDGDVNQLCEFMIDDNSEYFEPLEPDFRLVKILNNFSDENNVELIVILDEGIKRGRGYAGSGLGLDLVVSRKDLEIFTLALKDQYQSLVKNLQRIS